MYIQKAAEFPCLLDIDAILQLKLIELAPGVELKSRPSDRSKVHLISLRRIIPRDAESVAIKASSPSKDIPLLFEQETQLTEKSGLTIEDALLIPDGKVKVRVLLTNTTEAPQEVRENTAIDQVESVDDAKKKYTLLSKIDDLKVSEGAWTKEHEEVIRVQGGKSRTRVSATPKS